MAGPGCVEWTSMPRSFFGIALPAMARPEMARSALTQLNKIDVLVDRISKLTKVHTRRAEELVKRDAAPSVEPARSPSERTRSCVRDPSPCSPRNAASGCN